jgi:hypothetical protein
MADVRRASLRTYARSIDKRGALLAARKAAQEKSKKVM